MMGCRNLKSWIALMAVLLVWGCESPAPSGDVKTSPDVASDASSEDLSKPCEGEECDQCTTDADCTLGGFEFQCHPEQRMCVECLSDDDCGASGRCHPSTYQCVVCYADAHCNTGVCVSDGNFCVECLTDAHCASGHCDTTSKTCLGCIANEECDDGQQCTKDSCDSGQCANVVVDDGVECEAGACTLNDTCQAGVCVAGPDDPVCDICTVDDNCDKDSWCARTPGNCNAPEGVCTPTPADCESFGKAIRVCGCDGKTYTSDCHAQQAGVSVDYKGPCCPEFKCKVGNPVDSDKDGCVDTCKCTSSKECGSGQYCQLETCPSSSLNLDEQPSGVCTSCTLGGAICACDGVIYSDGCTASETGVAISSQKPKTCCKPHECPNGGMAVDTDADGCTDACVCDADKPCAPGAICMVDACADEWGVCTSCSQVEGPVCGCDGPKSFEDACDASSAGGGTFLQESCCEPILCADKGKAIDTDADGCTDACACQDHAGCGDLEYCALDSCDDAVMGLCTPCGDSKVCSCAGEQWENGCVAKQNEATVLAGGTCEPPTKDCLSTGECAVGEYCQKPLDKCEGLGTCNKQPADDTCEKAPVVEGGVCGCDSVTYEKPCQAAIAGVSLFAEKGCEKPPENKACKSTMDCGKSEFCERPLGDCAAAQGTCATIPAISSCGALPSNPVCGCDGNGYENECFAYANKVSLTKAGSCK